MTTPDATPRPEAGELVACPHDVVDTYFGMADNPDAPPLWACSSCKLRFYPACPECVGMGHRNIVHPAATPRPDVGLREALADLLDDTQHAEHECGDTDCPVTHARAALAATKPSPEDGLREACAECGTVANHARPDPEWADQVYDALEESWDVTVAPYGTSNIHKPMVPTRELASLIAESLAIRLAAAKPSPEVIVIPGRCEACARGDLANHSRHHQPKPEPELPWDRPTREHHVQTPEGPDDYCTGCGELWPCSFEQGWLAALAPAAAPTEPS